MNVNLPRGAFGVQQFGEPPCEGALCITQTLPFGSDSVQLLDLSAIQSTGRWSGLLTMYIDNSLNASPVFISCDVTYQTMTIPPLSCAYMPLLQPNPPKVTFTSAGGITIKINLLNYFLPPFVWSPTGAAGGAITVTVTPNRGPVTNKSGTITLGGTAQTLAAVNATRNYFIVQNPTTETEILQIRFAGGGYLNLVPGGSWESTSPFILTSLIEAVAATTGHVFTAYEG